MGKSRIVQVRRAHLADCLAIAQVQVDSYRTAYAGLFPESYLVQFTYEEQAQDWREWLATLTDEVLLVAVSAEEPVLGYVLARAQQDIYPGYDAEILALHVKQPYQGAGVGSALLKAAVGQLQEWGCRSVMLWALQGNPVREWYERLGGKVLGEKRFQVDGWDIVEVAYGWETMSTLLPVSRSGPSEVPGPDSEGGVWLRHLTMHHCTSRRRATSRS